jgi:hypothetical protein
MSNSNTLDISPLVRNFKTTGARDHPYFWINGASNFIPQLNALLDHDVNVKNISEFENDNSDDLKALIESNGSDKALLGYHKVYSSLIDKDVEIDLLEIGLGTLDPSFASTMAFYKQEAGLDTKPCSSIRAFRDYLHNSNIYGADIDRNILINEDRINTQYVDQLDLDTLNNLFTDKTFDVIIDDGLHHIGANLNTLRFALSRVNKGGYIIIEDIAIPENWKIVDHVLSTYDNVSETYFVNFGHVSLYVIHMA